ncbi:uridine kinase [Candidatus Woesearchaeota archaeon]|nr:uridine kinase [Candidatus Woesearchaeota archaeon]
MLTTQEGINYLRGYLSTCDRCILGVAGGSASGKSYLVDELHRVVNDSKILQMDDYYKGSSVILREKKIKGDSNDVNFDEPSAIDIDLLVEHLSLLKNGLKIKKPIYNFKRHERCDAEDYEPSKVIFLDGLFALNPALIRFLDLKIFMYAPAFVRYIRRADRDFRERGRTSDEIKYRWTTTVEPMYKLHIASQKDIADLVLSNIDYLPEDYTLLFKGMN